MVRGGAGLPALVAPEAMLFHRDSESPLPPGQTCAVTGVFMAYVIHAKVFVWRPCVLDDKQSALRMRSCGCADAWRPGRRGSRMGRPGQVAEPARLPKAPGAGEGPQRTAEEGKGSPRAAFKEPGAVQHLLERFPSQSLHVFIICSQRWYYIFWEIHLGQTLFPKFWISKA